MAYPGELFVGTANSPDRYQLFRRIGSGGEAEVWQGSRQLTDGPITVAVKYYHAARFDAVESLDALSERLETQAARLRQLHTPGLAAVHESFLGSPPHREGQSDGRQTAAYFVMDYIDGIPLTDWATGGQGALARLAILEDVAGALDVLHRADQVHGDIKGSNLLVTTLHMPDGSQVESAVLVDYGLVRRVTGQPPSELLGTIGFVAPELYSGLGYSPASDLYAFAVVCAQLLSGQRADDNVNDALEAAGLPHESHNVLLAGLDPDPRRRTEELSYGVGGWLSRLRGGLTTSYSAPAPDIGHDLAVDGDPLHRHPTTRVDPVGDGPSLISDTGPIPSKPTSRVSRLAVAGIAVVMVALAGVAYWSLGRPLTAQVGQVTVGTDPPVVLPEEPESLAADLDHVAALPVSDGLTVAFFAEAGVEVDSEQQVLSWTDQVAGNRLEPTNASPRLVPTGSNGHQAVEFVGRRTVLQMRDPTGLPVGPADRTVIVAANWYDQRPFPQHDGFLGVGWGAIEVPGSIYFQGSVLWTVPDGLIGGITYETPADDDPAPAIAGCCKDFGMAASDIFSPDFLAVGSIVEEGILKLYLGDRQLTSSASTWTFGTTDDRLWLGGFPTRDEVAQMDLAVVLVYDRALSQQEMTMITDHLRTTYEIDK